MGDAIYGHDWLANVDNKKTKKEQRNSFFVFLIINRFIHFVMLSKLCSIYALLEYSMLTIVQFLHLKARKNAHPQTYYVRIDPK